MNVKSSKLKEFFEKKLTINSDTGEFKYNNIDMLHSIQYCNDSTLLGNLIQKFFKWIPKISQMYSQNILHEITLCFNDYDLLHKSSCFDPRKFCLFAFFYTLYVSICTKIT